MTLVNYNGVNVHIVPKAIKHSYLRLKSDGSILMTVNHRLKDKQIYAILDAHLPKLKHKIAAIKELAANIRLNNGCSVHYLGQTYSLTIALASTSSVSLSEELIYLNVPNLLDNHEKRKVLHEWYFKQATWVFNRRLEFWLLQVQSWQISPPLLKIRPMQSRWGSYSKATHRICLNLWLIKVPIAIIDYVIAHELTHVLHYNHSKSFYQQLAKLYPQWQEKRKELKQIAKLYCPIEG